MILLQIYTIVIAAALAWFNRIPCKKMIDYGASIRDEKEWHRVNAVIKVLLAAGFTFYHTTDLFRMVLTFFLLLIIMWAVFDVVLSKMLHGRFFYLGKTSAIDKRFRTVFGVQEGFWKFLICVVIIAAINFFL
jgi:hypothetical protein